MSLGNQLKCRLIRSINGSDQKTLQLFYNMVKGCVKTRLKETISCETGAVVISHLGKCQMVENYVCVNGNLVVKCSIYVEEVEIANTLDRGLSSWSIPEGPCFSLRNISTKGISCR